MLSVFEGVPQREISRDVLSAGVGIIDVLAGGDAPFLASGGEARRALKENSISVNRNKVTAERELGLDDCIGSGLILLQRGKKNYFLVRVVG